MSSIEAMSPTRQEMYFRNEADHLRQDLVALQAELEDADTLITRQKRELQDARMKEGELQAENIRLQKAKKRLQSELDEMNLALNREKNDIADLTSRVKKFAKALNDEKVYAEGLAQEKSTSEHQLQQLQAKLDGAQEKIAALDRDSIEHDQQKRQLRKEIEDLQVKLDRSQQAILELDFGNNQLAHQLQEAKATILNLEREASAQEAEYRLLEGEFSASKAQAATTLQAKQEKIEELTRTITKAERDLKLMVDEEKNRREQVAAQRRLLESQIITLQSDLSALQRIADEQAKKIQVAQGLPSRISQLEREIDEVTAAKEALSLEVQEAKRKTKTLETNMEVLKENLSNAERAKRHAESELLEAHSDVKRAAAAAVLAGAEEKRKSEAKITELQADLGSLESTNKIAEDRVKKLEKSLEEANLELRALQRNEKYLIEAKSGAEMKLKDMEQNHVLLEGAAREKIREATGALEYKIMQLSQDLDAKVVAMETQAKLLRKAEQRAAEAEAHALDMKEEADAMKTNLEKTNNKLQLTKKQLSDAEAEVAKLTLHKATLSQELETTSDALQASKRNAALSRGNRDPKSSGF